MTNHEISYHIRGAAMEVYNTLGPGLLESVYHKALARELENRGLKVKSEVPVEVYYKGELIEEDALRLDIVVEDQVVLELKSVERLTPDHRAQLFNYMRLSRSAIGILANFAPKSAVVERYFLNKETNEIVGMDGTVLTRFARSEC